jgi:hypothetical protein
VGSLLLLIGCQQTNITTAVKTAFSNFDYVGEFGASNFAPPNHDARATQFPEFLKPDVLYVFHNPKKTDEQDLAMKVLPSRMRAAGITILESPSKLEDFAFVDPGGAAWKIRFRIGSQKGTFYNVLDKKRYYGSDATASIDADDYVLKLDK